MIGSKRTFPDIKKVDETYPLLKINKRETLIVLFIAPNEGIVVGGDPEYCLRFGEYRSTWHEENFTYYHGKVEIMNRTE